MISLVRVLKGSDMGSWIAATIAPAASLLARRR
jgi:hypothetical protein